MSLSLTLPGVPDAHVRIVSSLPESLQEGATLGRFWEATPGALLLKVPDVGTYLVRNGATIEVCVKEGADPAAVDVYLHGTARAALLHQRGDLPLHAACLLPPGASRAVAICGYSGNGKSTLTCEMLRRGWKLVADDTTRVTLQDGAPTVWPTAPAIKLWQDACDRMGIDTANLRPVRKGLKKFFYQTEPVKEPVALQAVLELRTEAGPLQRIEGLTQRMAVVSRHAFRPRQINALGVQKEHMRMALAVASSCAIGHLFGARSLPVQELADRVEEAQAWPETLS